MSRPLPLPDLPLSHLVLPPRTRGSQEFSSRHEQGFGNYMAEVVAQMIDREGWQFCCDDPREPELGTVVLSTFDVSGTDGMLPLILREAARLMRLALGVEPELRWSVEQGCLCVFEPADHQENSATLAVWALFCHYALETLVGANPKAVLEGEPVSLRNWREAFLADIDRGELRPVSTPTQRAAVRGAGELR